MNNLILYEPRNYKLYVHIRKKPNKKGVYKKYFGITCQTVNARWGKDGKKYKTKKKNGEYTDFYKAILKHGWNNFRHIVIFENLTRVEACKLEEFFIKTYNTIGKDGYNSKKGGLNGAWSEEVRKKFSESKKGKPVSNFKKSWIKGELNPLYGKKRPDELVKRIAIKHMKPVYCIEQNKWYTSAKEAGRINNINDGSISTCCCQNTVRITAGGLHWVHKIEDIKNIKFKPIKIYECIETNEIFYRPSDIERRFNKTFVTKVCNNKNRTCYGYHWKLTVIDKNIKECYTDFIEV